jgi:haloacid dehalogenase superfamily, subfamily IA, variant 3 with third motif having DD or ED
VQRGKLVIFDCDGVLVDSEPIAAAVTRRVLADLGWDLSIEEIVDRFVGGSSQEFQTQIEEHLGRTLPPGWNAPYAGWYQDAFDRELRAIEGIAAALDRIVMPRCVASNSGHDRVRHSLVLTGLIDHFEGNIFSAEDVPRGKPAPDLFLWAAREMGVRPQECVVVEDSRYGVQAARAAGMPVFAYAGGVTAASKLEGPSTTVFRSMAELPALLTKM